MAILRVANVHFEATGANRLEYLNSQVKFRTGGGNYTISVGATESVNIGAGGAVISGINVVPQIALAFDKANTGSSNGLSNSTTTLAGTLTVAGNTYVTANLGIGTTAPAANLDVRGSISDAGANTLSQTLTDGATINWNAANGRIATVTLGATGRTMAAPTNLRIGTYILHVLQDGSGNRTITTWNGVFKWPAGVAPTLTTTASARDVMTFVSDGTNLYGTYINDVK